MLYEVITLFQQTNFAEEFIDLTFKNFFNNIIGLSAFLGFDPHNILFPLQHLGGDLATIEILGIGRRHMHGQLSGQSRHLRLAHIEGNLTLALVTWGFLLGQISIALEEVGDGALAADARPLMGLAARSYTFV